MLYSYTAGTWLCLGKFLFREVYDWLIIFTIEPLIYDAPLEGGDIVSHSDVEHRLSALLQLHLGIGTWWALY